MISERASFEPSGQAGTELETLLELGQGGMATAYLARAIGTAGFQRLVVLKRMNLDLLGNRDAFERFLAEARVAARIHHANVVGTQQIGRDAAGPFIVLDYVEGGSLEDLVVASAERGEPLPVPVLLRIALDALGGLEAVHSAEDNDGRCLSILHRDVSLQNVLVGVHDGVTRLSDFGVAKSVLGGNRTDPSYLVGKLCYLAPEYLRREACAPSLDTYALGVTLWIALTGDELWPTATEGQIVRAILDEGIPPLAEHVQVAPEIAAFVARACHPDPDQRFRTAREMADAVESFGRDCGWVASHGEVAALVRQLLGERLRRRRETLTQLSAGARRGRRSGTHDRAFGTTTPDRRGPTSAGRTGRFHARVEAVRSVPAARPEPEPVEPSPAQPRPPAQVPRLAAHWRPVHGVALLLGISALSLVALFLVGDPKPRPAREVPPSSQPGESIRETLRTPPEPRAAKLEPTPELGNEPLPEPAAATITPVAPASASVTPPKRPPMTRPATEPIRKKNPYR